MNEQRIVPFLTLNGQAEEAMKFYTAIPGVEILSIDRYEKLPGTKNEYKNNVLTGVLSFFGQKIMFMDMNEPCPDFTWATSIFVDCQDENEFDAVFAVLSNGGTVLMGPEAVLDIRKCAWVTDKFGVTWQPVWK